MAFGKPLRRRPDEDQRIMPLINVVFLLLIFFMVAGQLSKTDPVTIDPPVSESETEPDARRLRLLITADGRVLLRGEDTAIDDLPRMLADALAEGAHKTVHVKADGDADVQHVIAILDRIKAAGAEKVKLLTSARRGP
ncbi:MAG: biopolymer transporter ExbD [Rhodospirillales bacterium]|nr:biopolymer transporter ExbD [Rhodospirillales bacterium]MBO6785712.1 biopolymer transporter ExbD [Rhodospirillales bacterium]